MKKTIKYLMAIIIPLMATIAASCSDDVEELMDLNGKNASASIEVTDITATSAIVTVTVNNVDKDGSLYASQLIYSEYSDFSSYDTKWGSEQRDNVYVYELTRLEPGTEYFIKFNAEYSPDCDGIRVEYVEVDNSESSFTTLLW